MPVMHEFLSVWVIACILMAQRNAAQRLPDGTWAFTSLMCSDLRGTARHFTGAIEPYPSRAKY
jgi:hypothetical protein